MSKKIKQVLFYYGFPNAINESWEINNSAQQIAQYDIWIVGDAYNNPEHEAHADTVAIINKLREIKPELEIFGYIPCANYHDPDDVYQDEPLTVEQLKGRIDWWIAMGVDGIFLDEWGYDYKNDRVRQNQIVQYIKDHNLIPFYNSWNDEYTFSSKDIVLDWLGDYHPNPDQIAPVKVPKSYFLIEDMFWGIDDASGTQQHGDVWTVYRPYEYYYNEQPELSGRTFYSEYKSEPVALDGILKKTEPTDTAAQMRTISIYMSIMLNIHYLAFGDEEWGSGGNCYHWTVPPLLVNKPEGLTNVTVKSTTTRTWEWNCTIDGVRLKALWGDNNNLSMSKGTREVYVNDVKVVDAWKSIAPLYDLRSAEKDINNRLNAKEGGFMHNDIKFHIDGTGLMFGKTNKIYQNNGKLTINGNDIYHEGNKPSVMSLPGVETFTKSVAITAGQWTDLGIKLATGTYVVELLSDNNKVLSGRGNYGVRYSGICSSFDSSTNASDISEIVLQASGHAINELDIYLGFKLTPGNNGTQTFVISSNTTIPTTSYTLKFRRLI